MSFEEARYKYAGTSADDHSISCGVSLFINHKEMKGTVSQQTWLNLANRASKQQAEYL